MSELFNFSGYQQKLDKLDWGIDETGHLCKVDNMKIICPYCDGQGEYEKKVERKAKKAKNKSFQKWLEKNCSNAVSIEEARRITKDIDKPISELCPD